MNQTFQTNDEREEYNKLLGNMHEKCTNMDSEASIALGKKWDTRKELRKIANPHAG